MESVESHVVSTPVLQGAAETVSLAQLGDIARSLWERLPDGAVLWLSGELGAGKTSLVRALCEVAGATPATSPTFALVHEYQSDGGSIVHVDCYRLRSPEEAADLDLDALQRSARLVAIEWPEKAGPFAPPATIHLHLEHVGGSDLRTVRRIA